MSTHTMHHDALDAELDDYGLRAGRYTGKKSTAELIGYAATAGGLAFAGGDAMGAIVHNTSGAGPFNVTVTTTIGQRVDTKFQIDLDGIGGDDLSFIMAVGHNIGAGDYGFVRNSSTIASGVMLVTSTGGVAVPLAAGQVLSGTGTAAPGGNFWYNTQNSVFNNVNGSVRALPFSQTTYIGFRFEGDTGTIGQQFAYLKVFAEYDTTSANHSVSFNILEWTYDNSGAALVFNGAPAGSAPTPSTPLLALLGMGAMGIQGYRRRRNAGLKQQADASPAA